MRPTLSHASVRAPLVALVALAGVTCAIYWPALYGPFLLDDGSNIPQTRLDRFTLAGLLDVALGNDSGLFGRPVPVVSFALNYFYGDGGPFGFKLVNLLIHCLNAALVCLFSRLALDACARASRTAPAPGTLRLAALAATALWALHPLQLSTVMYAVQRMALLSSTFSLLALIVYLHVRLRQLAGQRAGRRLPAAMMLSTLLACLSKENGALIPVHVLLMEVLLFRFATASGRSRRFGVSLAAWTALPVVVAALYFILRSDVLLSGYEQREFDMIERLWTQASVMVSYLRMIFLPTLSEMTFYHDGTTLVRGPSPQALGHAAVVLGACALIPLFARRAPVLSLGLGLFFVSHLLESTFLPLELAFEHRNYFGIIGLSLPIAWYAVVVPAGRSDGARSAARASVCAVLVFLALQTHVRALEWSSDIALHAFAVENAPDSLRARTTLGILLARQGDLERGIDVLDEAAAHWPDSAFVPLLIVERQSLAGRWDPERSKVAEHRLRDGVLDEYTASLLASMHAGLRSGRSTPVDAYKLERFYAAALSADERRVKRSNEAMLNAFHAELLGETNRAQEAKAALERAHALAPSNVEIRLRLAERLAFAGELERAGATLRALESTLPESDYRESERVRVLAARIRYGEVVPADER